MTSADAKGQATPPKPKAKQNPEDGAEAGDRRPNPQEHQDERTLGSGALPKPSAGDDVDPGVG